MDLKVAIDARHADPRVSGIDRYTLNLLRGIGAVGPGFRVAVLVSAPSALPADVGASQALELVPWPRAAGRLADQWRLREAARRLGVRVLHTPDAFAPLAAPCRTVITLHDLIGLVCRPLLRASAKGRWPRTWKVWLQAQCRAADAIVTVSRHSAADLARLLWVPRGKVHVIPNAPGLGPARGRAGQGTPGAGGRFVLCVGRADPYKNLVGLVRAFRIVRDRLGAEVRLVIVGRPDPRYPEAGDEVRRLGLADAVDFAGHVSDERLATLYGAAGVYAAPSLYEGFGLSPLEAMGFGTPVVSSDRASLPEVLADAALYADPESPEAMAAAIVRVLSDGSLAARLGSAGRRRAAEFSLRRTAAAHLDLYERLARRVP